MITELMLALDEIEEPDTRGDYDGRREGILLRNGLEALRADPDLSHHEPAAEPKEPPTEGMLDVALRLLKGETGKDAVPLQPEELALESSRTMAGLFRRLYDFPIPLIAAVNGLALAWLWDLDPVDFTLAATGAKSRLHGGPNRVHSRPGCSVPDPAGWREARPDLLLTGRIFGAEEAHQLGLVNEVVPSDQLLKQARELAAQLTELSRPAFVRTKRLLRDFSQKEIDRELELAIEENARIRSTADFREGVSAFLEKRKPVWSAVGSKE
jgi:methylglutaconyl-CoA hydratase